MLAGWRILAVNVVSATGYLHDMDLSAELAIRFDPDAAQDVDAVVALATNRETLATFSVHAGRLQFAPSSPPDVTFTFDSTETALGILAGAEDPIAAFLAGRFRSDGHLPLTFVLLGLFRRDYDAAPPP